MSGNGVGGLGVSGDDVVVCVDDGVPALLLRASSIDQFDLFFQLM